MRALAVSREAEVRTERLVVGCWEGRATVAGKAGVAVAEVVDAAAAADSARAAGWVEPPLEAVEEETAGFVVAWTAVVTAVAMVEDWVPRRAAASEEVEDSGRSLAAAEVGARRE